MTCSGPCWRTTYNRQSDPISARYIGNPLPEGDGVEFKDSSAGIAWFAPSEYMIEQFPDEVSGCDPGCSCLELPDQNPPSSKWSEWTEVELVIVHDSRAGRCIIEVKFRYRVSSRRYEGNCSKTKGQQKVVRFIEDRAVTEAIVLKEFPLQKIDSAESGRS